MSLNNLYYTIAYPQGYDNLGILVLLHGWDSQIVNETTTKYYANKGFFVISVAMRGRSGGQGTRDASGREIYDIYDAIKHIRTVYANKLNGKVSILGWSGGGGNALAFACKFPDLCEVVVDFFGMSDYGYDPITSWGMTDGWYKPYIETSVGETVGIQGNKHRSRYAVSAITNYIGKLYLFHHSTDYYINTIHSQKIITSLQNANKTNFIANISTDIDVYQYIHGLALNSASHNYAESLFIPVIKNEPTVIIPTIGTLEILGFLETKRFSIWLDDGRSSVANVNYNTITKTYVITPITSGNITVRIEQDGIITTQTINSETTIIL